jgi:toxin-antitoxin system PIN domain toxin
VKIVDLNVLLYAINRDSAHHEVVRTWWDSALNADEPIGLAWTVLLGFLRLATHPRVFPRPLEPAEAFERVEAWLRHSNVRVVPEGDEHWRMLRELLGGSGTAGNLTTDAHLASLAIAHGATLVSCDADFARFTALRWENPVRV